MQKKNLCYKDLPREITDELWRQYREGIEPLKRSGKLAAVHFQFAPWVAYHPKNRDHIEGCQRQLEGYQLAIEFRNKTWFEGKHAAVTLGFERKRNLVNVIVDEPQGIAPWLLAIGWVALALTIVAGLFALRSEYAGPLAAAQEAVTGVRIPVGTPIKTMV